MAKFFDELSTRSDMEEFQQAVVAELKEQKIEVTFYNSTRAGDQIQIQIKDVNCVKLAKEIAEKYTSLLLRIHNNTLIIETGVNI